MACEKYKKPVHTPLRSDRDTTRMAGIGLMSTFTLHSGQIGTHPKPALNRCPLTFTLHSGQIRTLDGKNVARVLHKFTLHSGQIRTKF